MKKNDPLSIKDIARSARVSHSTVSRALRNSPLVNAAGLRRAILSAAL
jgi:DNA-binding LacI/PurR family transcriptional regulator